MSEFLAEARILVRPDTSRFRVDLEKQLQSVLARPVKIPVVPVVGPGFGAAAAGTAAFTAAQVEAASATNVTAAALASATTIERQYAGAVDLSTVATNALAAAQVKEAASATEAAAAQAVHTRGLNQGVRGAAASGLSLLGLRGATLAASGAFLAGTAAVVGFGKAVQSAAELQTELNVFKVTAGATADEMNRVSTSVKQLGADLTLPGVTAGQAAQTLTLLSKAGLDVNNSLSAVRGTLQLATAAQIDNADAAKLVAGSLNSFELAGRNATKVADLFTGAAAASQGEVDSLQTALGQAAAVAHGFGVSIEDTITLLTQLAKAGLEGGRAGTSLRVAMLRLIKPPADAAAALKQLNVQAKILDDSGNFRPQIFTDIEKALQGYTAEQKNALRATIFGSDAIRTQILLGQQGPAAFNAIKDAVTEQGLAQEQASARTKGLTGDIENLSNQASALGLTLGQVAAGPTSLFVKSLADVVSNVNLVAEGTVNLTKKITDFSGSVDESVPLLGAFDDHLGDIVKAGFLLNPLTGQLKAAAEGFKLLGLAGQKSAADVSVFGDVADSVTQSTNALAKALAEAAARTQAEQPQLDQGLNVKQVQNVVAGFDAEEVRARISKDNAQILDVLNTERAFLTAQIQRDYVKNRPALKRALENALLGVNSDIDSILGKAQADVQKRRDEAERAAREAAAAATAREQALLSQFGVARDQRQNAIAAAAATKTLNDDIAQQKKLKALVLTQIAAVKERISVEGGRVAAVTALRSILIQVNGALDGLAEQQRKAAVARRQELVQSATLDVDFAQIQGNQAAEISARERLIVQLKKEQALVKRGTNEYKTLRNEIARETAAIADLRKEKDKQKNLFAEQSFQFLQDQQGFASNLLGNLIPTSATGGLVGGGVSPVQAALQPVAETTGKSGPTSGQANATNSLLFRMLEQLKILNGTQATPEANRQNRGQRAVMDGVGGG